MSEPTDADYEKACTLTDYPEDAEPIARALAAERAAGFAVGLKRAAEHILDPKHRERYVMLGPRVMVALAHEIVALPPEQEKPDAET